MSIESGNMWAKLIYEEPSSPLPVDKPCECGETVDESIDVRLLQLLVDIKECRLSYRKTQRASVDTQLERLAREFKNNKQ